MDEKLATLIRAAKQATTGLIDVREGETEFIGCDLITLEDAIRAYEPDFNAEEYWEENEASKETTA